MGNWRTVNLVGSIDPKDVPAARDFVDVGDYSSGGWDRFHPLCHCGPSLCGLGQWVPAAGGEIHAVGNLAERDYSVSEVAETLRELVAVAPSLDLKVHCGGEYEDTKCIATVVASALGVVVGPPEVDQVGDGLQELAMFRLGQIVGGAL